MIFDNPSICPTPKYTFLNFWRVIMKKHTLFFLFLFVSVILWAAPSSMDQIEQKVNQIEKDQKEILHEIPSLERQQVLLDKKVTNLTDVIEASNSSINNSLTSTSNYLTVVSIILGLVAAALACYVTYLERKMTLMKDSVGEMCRTVSEKEKEVKKLVDEVNHDVEGLFKRIQREDTKAVLQRLVEVPEDIDNLIRSLFTRVLLPEDYLYLKKAFMKLKAQGTLAKPKEIVLNDNIRITAGIDPEDAYLAVFFQHFTGKAVEDTDLSDKIVAYFKDGLDLAFDNDVRMEIENLSKALSKKEADYDRKKVLRAFRDALSQSERTKDHPEYLELLREKVTDAQLWEE